MICASVSPICKCLTLTIPYVKIKLHKIQCRHHKPCGANRVCIFIFQQKGACLWGEERSPSTTPTSRSTRLRKSRGVSCRTFSPIMTARRARGSLPNGKHSGSGLRHKTTILKIFRVTAMTVALYIEANQRAKTAR